MASTDRFFHVGETVHLRARTSPPGTREPLDVQAVTLSRLTRDKVTPVPVADGAFGREAEGDYRLILATDSLLPGSYDVMVRVESLDGGVVLLADRFVLRAL